MPVAKIYYDPKKYLVSKNAPEKWGQVTPQFGFKEFVKAYLTDEDCRALISINSPHVTLKTVSDN